MSEGRLMKEIALMTGIHAKRTAGFTVICLLLSQLSVAKIIYVSASASGANDGTNWLNAYPCLHTALDSAAEYDEIWVATGIYKPIHSYDYGTEIYRHFRLKSNVALYGGFAGTETTRQQRSTDPSLTILSGDLNNNDNDNLSPNEPTRSDNCLHIIYNGGGLNNAILDGFTIRGGNARAQGHFASGGGLYNSTYNDLIINNCVFTQNTALSKGGGLFYCNDPQFRIEISDCTFIDNFAENGGGVYCWGNSTYSDTQFIMDSTFLNNSATNGGGMYVDSGWLTVADCTFSENSAQSGGGMFNNQCSPTITDCNFLENSAPRGGGMFNLGHLHNPTATPTITRCFFSRNFILYSSDFYLGGGGIYNYSSSPLIIDSIFEDNIACTDRSVLGGGGIVNYVLSNPTITGCAFSGNIADDGGGIINVGGSPTISSCTFRNNHATHIHGSGGAICSFIFNYWSFNSLHDGILSEPIITHCIFEDNTANGNSSTGGFDLGQVLGGGAIQGVKEVSYCTFNRNCAPFGGAITDAQSVNECVFNENTAQIGGAIYSAQSVTHCIFNDNSATNTGGALKGGRDVSYCTFKYNSASSSGGAFYADIDDNTVALTNCTFIGNSVNSTANFCHGGAVYIRSDSSTITNCSFIQNTLTSPGSAYGGAVYSIYKLSVNNSIFIANTAAGSNAYGGGLYSSQTDATKVANCTLVANAAVGVSNSIGGGIVMPNNPASSITNCILWDNFAMTGWQIPVLTNVSVTYNIIQGGYPGMENLDTNPLFVSHPNPGHDGLWATEDDDFGDLRLQSHSPCVDTGNNEVCDPNIISDFAGSPRIIDGNCDSLGIIDKGAYEYFLPGDLNTTCRVDWDDLSLFIPVWLQNGCTSPDNCGQADLNRTGAVDLADWAIFASRWLTASVLCDE